MLVWPRVFCYCFLALYITDLVKTSKGCESYRPELAHLVHVPARTRLPKGASRVERMKRKLQNAATVYAPGTGSQAKPLILRTGFVVPSAAQKLSTIVDACPFAEGY